MPALSTEVYNFILARGLKSYQLSKFEYVNFNSKIEFTFLIWLITFKLLKLKQSYILHLKVLTCDIDAWVAQWRSCIFILCYTYLKVALLLQKTALTLVLALVLDCIFISDLIRKNPPKFGVFSLESNL